MGLQGAFETMPVEELFQWMLLRDHTGILTIQHGDVTKTLTLSRGKIINAASTDAREYFGQFLINFGLVSEDQLQKAFETQQETKVLIGRILVMTGLVSEEQLLKILGLKIRETTLDVFLWNHGVFNFHEGVIPQVAAEVEASVDLKGLFTEGMKRRKQYQEIRQTIPDNYCGFKTQLNNIPRDLDPKSLDWVMLQLAHQGYSAADIILRFHSLDFPILKNLHELIRRNWLTVAAPAVHAEGVIPDLEVQVDIDDEEPQTSPANYLQSAQAAIAKRDFEGAAGILRRGLGEHPYDPELSTALEVADRGLAETLRAELLSDKKIPYLLRDDVLRISANWSPAQRYILSRIDGQRNLRSIIMVSPLKEVEALKTFRSLIQAGLVGLK